MERDPDIAALAALLGLQDFGYRTFARPVLARPAPAPLAAVLPPAPEALAVTALPEAPLQPASGRITAALPEPAAPAPSDAFPHFPLLAQVFLGGAAAVAPLSAQPFLALRRAVAGQTDPAEH